MAAKIKTGKLSEFRPQVKNANKHTPRGMKALSDAMSKSGYVAPITATADGEAIDGSARLETAYETFSDEAIIVEHDGTKPIVMVRTDIKSAKSAKAKRIALEANRVAQIDLDWDLDVLKGMDADVMDGLFDADDLVSMGLDIGAGAGTGADAEPQVDRAAELAEKWGVKRGQVWRLGEHRIMCGDSTSKDDVAKLMQGERAALVFTDPPYGVAIGAKNRLLNSVQKAGRNLTDIEDDSLSPEDLKAKLLPSFQNIKSVVMADDCTVFVTAPQGGELSMMMMMRESGLPVRHVLIWKKNAPTFSMGRLDYDYQHEPILLTWGKRHKRPMGGAHKTSVWEVDKPRASADHPTMKPVELYENALLNNSDRGDVCFDAYSGSGTMIMACERQGRMARVMEISEGYVAVALQRWADATGGTPELIEGAK